MSGCEDKEEKEERGVLELTSEWPLPSTIGQFHSHSHSSDEENIAGAS